MTPKIKDVSGIRFGKLLATSPLDVRGSNYKVMWECLCDCGNKTTASLSDLTTGNTKSCGCNKYINPERTSKTCGGCKKFLPVENFHLNKNMTDGHTNICKTCCSLRKKSNLPKSREYENKRRNTDINYKIKKGLRSRIYKALKSYNKSATTVELVGCSIDELRDYLESMFDNTMTWDNYGIHWHVDHIRPCASFDLSHTEEQRICFHYTNLQPLEKHENWKKGDRYE